VKPLQIRPLADQDIDRSFLYLQQEAPHIAAEFLDAVEAGFKIIQQNPDIGSLRYQHILPVEGLRFWRIGKFPHLIFYFNTTSSIDIARILHGHQDIRATLGLN